MTSIMAVADLVASCVPDCTRLSCSPLLGDNLTCTTVAENTNCFEDPATQTGICTNIRANFHRSYVRSVYNNDIFLLFVRKLFTFSFTNLNADRGEGVLGGGLT